MKKNILYFLLLVSSSFFLSACNQKNTAKITPTPLPRQLELTDDLKPTLNLSTRADGHELTLNISKINSLFSKIEYELIYKAIDGELEIEKGISGQVESKDISNSQFEKKLLLGTESCTNGCKYKYDTGVVGGTLIVSLFTKDNQVASIEKPFKLNSVKGKGYTVTFED